VLTLIIPTYNRPHHLDRLLGYYQGLGFSDTIIVADSSDSEQMVQNESTINAVRPALRMEHRRYDTSIGIATKLSESLAQVSTPYSVVAADDDFFVPNTLGQGTEFLETHSDYSIVHGQAAKFGLEPGRPVYGAISRVSRYTQRTVDLPSASERLTAHLSNYSTTFYSVQRTEQLHGNFRKAVYFESDMPFIELLPSCLSLIQGKAMAMDGLFMLRESHAKRVDVPGAFDWVTSPDWTLLYGRFCNCLAEELATQDRISVEEAQIVVRQSFWRYLVRFLSITPSRPRERNRLQKAAGALPGVRPIWRRLLRAKAGSQGGMSLASLRRPSSPYYADFMPIYRAVATSPIGIDLSQP